MALLKQRYYKMLREFEQLIYDIGNLSDNDGYDPELDNLSYKLNELLENATLEELESIYNKPYMKKYRNLIKSKMEEK